MSEFPQWVQRGLAHAGLIDPRISRQATGEITIEDSTGRVVLFTGTSLREITPMAAASQGLKPRSKATRKAVKMPS